VRVYQKRVGFAHLLGYNMVRVNIFSRNDAVPCLLASNLKRERLDIAGSDMIKPWAEASS
jgi:hypothetical protein